MNVLNPDAIVFAGGLAWGREFFEPMMLETLRAGAVAPALERLVIAWEGRAEALAIRGVADLAVMGAK